MISSFNSDEVVMLSSQAVFISLRHGEMTGTDSRPPQAPPTSDIRLYTAIIITKLRFTPLADISISVHFILVDGCE